MHEEDAMEFITTVLIFFFDRVFGDEVSGDESIIAWCNDMIRDFIRDDSAFWVKEKANIVIIMIGRAECTIRKGIWKPKSPKRCVETILHQAKKAIEKEIFNDENNETDNLLHLSIPYPSYPGRNYRTSLRRK